MGKVRTGHSMSLDGCIAGPNDGPEAPMGDGGERLLAWYSAGDTEYRLPATEMVFRVSPQTAELLCETSTTTGALVTGRRTFLGGTGLCSYPYGPTRVGLRRIAVHVRHGRPRKRPSASQSGRGRQGCRRDRREPRAAVHQSGTPRRDTRRPGAHPARRRRPDVRPPGHRVDRAGEHPGDRGSRGNASYLPRRKVKCQSDQGFWTPAGP